MKKLLISTFAAAVMLLFGGVNEVNGDPLTYEVVGDTVTIKDCKETASGALAIPLPMTENRVGDKALIRSVKENDGAILLGVRHPHRQLLPGRSHPCRVIRGA